jgi:hypothetical protein
MRDIVVSIALNDFCQDQDQNSQLNKFVTIFYSGYFVRKYVLDNLLWSKNFYYMNCYHIFASNLHQKISYTVYGNRSEFATIVQ